MLVGAHMHARTCRPQTAFVLQPYQMRASPPSPEARSSPAQSQPKQETCSSSRTQLDAAPRNQCRVSSFTQVHMTLLYHAAAQVKQP